MTRHLETERLVLRPFAEMPVGLYVDLIAERGPGARGFGTTADEAARNIARLERVAHDTGIGLLAVRRRHEGDVIGYCGLIAGRTGVDEPELAYELFRRAHGRGYATEAAVAVIGAAGGTGRRRLWSTVRSGNDASFRVLAKTGFQRDHTESDAAGRDLVYLVRDLRLQE